MVNTELAESAQNYLQEARDGEQRMTLRETLQLFTRARDTAHLAEDKAAEFDALCELGWVLTQEDVGAGVKFLEEALGLAEGRSEWWRMPYPVEPLRKGLPSLSPVACQARLAAALGRNGESERCYRLVEAVMNTGWRATVLECLLWLGEALVTLGLFERAEEVLREMPYQVKSTGVSLSVARDFCALGELYVSWGRPAMAVSYLDLAWDTGRLMKWRGILCRSGVGRARSMSAAGFKDRNPRAALRVARRVLGEAYPDGRFVDAVGALVVSARIQLELGEPEDALKSARSACEFARTYPGLPIALREESFVVLQHVARTIGRELRAGEVTLDPVESFRARTTRITDANVRRLMVERMSVVP
jgi:hypothetical protein